MLKAAVGGNAGVPASGTAASIEAMLISEVSPPTDGQSSTLPKSADQYHVPSLACARAMPTACQVGLVTIARSGGEPSQNTRKASAAPAPAYSVSPTFVVG